MESQDKYLDVEQAANYLGVKRAKLYNLIRDFKVQSYRLGTNKKLSFFKMSDLDKIKAASQEYLPKNLTGTARELASV